MCASDARAICIRGNTWLRIRYFPPRTTERTRGVGAGAYYHPMGKRGAQDPIAENHLGPYWTPSSTRRPAKSPNLAVPAESPGVPKPAKRGRAPARLPPAPPERPRESSWLTRHPLQVASRTFVKDAAGRRSRLRCQPKAAEWRAQLADGSEDHSCPTPPVLLFEHSRPTRPPPLVTPRPAVAAMPIEVLDISVPIASVVVPIHGSPRASLTPTTCVHASSPSLSQADTLPPGLHPPRRPTSASPPIVFTGGKHRRHGDLLQLSELPAVAAAYSPLRAKAARKAASQGTTIHNTQ